MTATTVAAYAERLRARLHDVYQGDEARAQSELYGSPRQDVTRIEPDPPTRQSDDAPVLGGRVV